VDRFKGINDTLGHDTGDCLLTGVATRLKNTLRQADTLARLGGDEFTLIVEDLYHETEYENIVITIAQKILESFSSPFSVGGKELFVTPSIGITLYPFDGMMWIRCSSAPMSLCITPRHWAGIITSSTRRR
jgi:diguanylate cyclase (GGDEF)-like protein